MVLNKLYRSPDPAPAGGAATPRKTGSLPVKDADVSTVAQALKTKWGANPFFVLQWMTQAAFATMADDFATQLAARQTAGGARSPFTDALDTADAKIDDGVREVKTYIAAKFGAQHATANYAPFGIVHEKKSWVLPQDHSKRRDALPMMIAAIAANGMGANEFGTTFWTDLQTEFNTALTGANATDSVVSTKVSAKNVQKNKIKDVMRAILLLLEANYPDTFEGEKRAWGFQKEDY